MFHTPESKDSLVSVPCLTERELRVKFDRFGIVIFVKHGVAGTAKKNGRMYIIDQCDDNPEQKNKATTSIDIQLLYHRLGHADHDLSAAFPKTTPECHKIKRSKLRNV